MRDPDRQPLDAAVLAARLATAHGLVRSVTVHAETESTNDDVAALAAAGAPEGTVVVAEHQRRGRGRLDRTWVVPPRAGLTFSVLLRPGGVPPERWSWLPLLAGCAVAAGVATASGVAVALKWPNDVLVGEAKLGGILAQRVDTPAGPAAVLGIGLNVTQGRAELLPAATAIRIARPGAPTDRAALLCAVLDALADRYGPWVAGGGDPADIRADYVARCATLGRWVRVELEPGRVVEGEAVDVDGDGRLVIATSGGDVVGGSRMALGAGDVVHVR